MKKRKGSDDSCPGLALMTGRRLLAYLRVLAHSYCRFNNGENEDKLNLIPRIEGKCDLNIAITLTDLFDSTYHIFVAPNEEKYYINASRSFEPTFAIDIYHFLFGTDMSQTGTRQHSTDSLLETLYLCEDEFFTKQQDAWSKLLYFSGESYEKFVSLLMLDYLRRRANKNRANKSQCLCSLCIEENMLPEIVLEFPYEIELCLRERYQPSDKNFAQRILDQYRERVEEYFYNVMTADVNRLSQDKCEAIGERFYSYLSEEYKAQERYLHRILPINRNNYKATEDVPTYSVLLSNNRLLDLVGSMNGDTNWSESIPGWGKFFDKIREVNSNSNNPNDSIADMAVDLNLLQRLVRYDQRGDAKFSGRCEGCCVDEKESCQVLAEMIFEKM